MPRYKITELIDRLVKGETTGNNGHNWTLKEDGLYDGVRRKFFMHKGVLICVYLRSFNYTKEREIRRFIEGKEIKYLDLNAYSFSEENVRRAHRNMVDYRRPNDAEKIKMIEEFYEDWFGGRPLKVIEEWQ